MNWAWHQDIKPVPKLILMALADAADDQGICWPSVATIAIKVGVSTRTVRRVMQTLIRRELLSAEQRYRSDGSCSSNRYRLLLEGGDKLSPAPDRSDTTPRHPCQGPPDCSVIPGTTIGTIKEPPLPPVSKPEQPDRGGGEILDLYYPKDLLPSERSRAEAMIGALNTPINQQVLDEWAGIITAGAIRSSTLGCLRTLCRHERCNSESCDPSSTSGSAERSVHLRNQDGPRAYSIQQASACLNHEPRARRLPLAIVLAMLIFSQTAG